MSAEKCLDIIREKGAGLTSEDLHTIQYLMTEIPLDDLPDQSPWIYEAIHLIVSDPLYEGDITLADLAEPAD